MLSGRSIPESIWNGNDPSPVEAVERLEAVDIPSILRLGGAGSSPSVSFDSWLKLGVWGVGGATTNVC